MRRPPSWIGCAVVATMVAATAGEAHAAEKDPRKAAIKLIAQGDRLFKKGDFVAALAKYQEAYQIFPSPKIFYAMAKAEEKLGRTLDALAHYEQFLSEAGDEVNEDLRVDAQVSVQELEKTLAVVRFDVKPDGVTVAVDGHDVGVSPLDRPVRLAPGEHAYHFSKSGFVAVDKSARLAAGDKLEEQITLREDRPPPVAEEPRPPASVRAHRSGGESAVLWTGVGLTSALAVGWAVTGLAALRDHDRFGDAQLSLDERASARDSGKAWALTSDLLLAGTLAAATFTTWWYLDTRPEVGVVPYASGEGGGVSLVGAF